MSKIKLSPKQLTTLQQIQGYKVELNKLMQAVNEKEALILELIFEYNSIVTGEISNVKLTEEGLEFDHKAVSESKGKKVKKQAESETK